MEIKKKSHINQLKLLKVKKINTFSPYSSPSALKCCDTFFQRQVSQVSIFY